MKLMRRLMELIYVIIVIILSVFLILIPFDFKGKLSIDSILVYVNMLKGNYLFSLIGLLILLISIKYFLAILRWNKTSKEKLKSMTLNNEYGEVTIYDETVSGLVRNVSKEFAGIDNIRTKIDFINSKIDIYISGEAESEISIPQISNELQKRVKEDVEEATGAEVNKISVKITKIKNME